MSNLATAGGTVSATSNFVTDANGNCIAGVTAFTNTTIATAVSSGVQVVTPDSMTDIVNNLDLTIDTGKLQETVTVSSNHSNLFHS
jgi:hypothetical protein